MKKVIEYRCKCAECKGTGLYVGMGERDGAAVVCYRCKGEGVRDMKIEYEDFEGRESRPGVKQVYETNPGICIGTGKTGELSLEDFGGMSYADWQGGRPFEVGMENRRFTCPYWWYQSADHRRTPKWDKCMDSLGRPFSNCKHFHDKAECWKQWDSEQPQFSKDSK